MLSKESKIRILENFQAIDYVIFGKPVGKTGVCCPFFTEEYLATKGALLSVVIEMYKLMGHTPKVLKEEVDSNVLTKMSKRSATIARENCKALVSSPDGRKDVKKSLRESLLKVKTKKVNIDEMIQTEIRRKSYGLAIDNLLVGRAIAEGRNVKNLNTWNGTILEDAYKTLRDSVVECAMTILENKV
jgi:septum formation topological specificity factor MinE